MDAQQIRPRARSEWFWVRFRASTVCTTAIEAGSITMLTKIARIASQLTSDAVRADAPAEARFYHPWHWRACETSQTEGAVQPSAGSRVPPRQKVASTQTRQAAASDGDCSQT
jgi:hypothetical protein